MKNIKGLRISIDSGEGEVVLPPDFQNSNPLFRADVLGDWLSDIQSAYNDAVMDMGAEFTKITPEAYRRQLEAENIEGLANNLVNLQSLVGKTIASSEISEDGAIQLVFTDGTKHAVYHAKMHAGLPVQVSQELSKEEAAALS